MALNTESEVNYFLTMKTNAVSICVKYFTAFIMDSDLNLLLLKNKL